MADSSQADREQRLAGLYRVYQPRLVQYARRRLPAADADDAVAEAFLVVWRKLDDVPEDPLPWLYRIVGHAVGNQRRRAVRWGRLHDRATALFSRAPAIDPGLADHASRAFRQAWQALPERDREILRLAAWEGLSGSALAVAAGCAEPAARARLHRARRRLADLLDHAPDGASHRGPRAASSKSDLQLRIGDAND